MPFDLRKLGVDYGEMNEMEPLFDGYAPRYTTRVYFGLSEADLIKIGLTGRPSGHRGGEVHFTEVFAIPGDRTTESFYQAKYGARRVGRSEWFNPDNKMLIEMLTMCAKYGDEGSTRMLQDYMIRRWRRLREEGKDSAA